MIRIAIDGPGGAGKSSVAKLIARDLSIIYVDTGALYRSIGLFILEKGISPTDRAAVIDQLKNIDLKLKFTDRQILLLNGVDVGDRIRTPEISMAASAVSVAGMLCFVGLIVPHMVRMLVGSDFSGLLPCSAVFGAALVTGADTAARCAFDPVEVPVGLFMSFLGAPFFLYLLRKGMRGR